MDVVLSGVKKRYDGREVLRGVDLEVGARTTMGLIGPNGSGKSTLLRVVMGLVQAEGTVRVGSCSPFTERERIAGALAYVPQTAPQLGASVREIVAAVSTLRGLSAERVRSLAERFEIDLDAVAGRPFRALSGGMKQKVLIVLAFASEASLFVLDEPTASLDVRSRAAFLEVLEEVRGAATIILCSHHPGEIERLVSRTLQLDEGRLLPAAQRTPRITMEAAE